MASELDAKLERFLDDQERERTHGITLESLRATVRDLADGLMAHEQKETTWRDELRAVLLSMTHRIETLEAGYVELRARMQRIEAQLAQG